MCKESVPVEPVGERGLLSGTMLSRFTCDSEHVFPAIGATDFRKQTESLVSMVNLQFELQKAGCPGRNAFLSSEKILKSMSSIRRIPAPVLSHSISIPALVAQIMGLPLNRQEKDWFRLGLVLTRAEMVHWVMRSATSEPVQAAYFYYSSSSSAETKKI